MPKLVSTDYCNLCSFVRSLQSLKISSRSVMMESAIPESILKNVSASKEEVELVGFSVNAVTEALFWGFSYCWSGRGQ